MALDRVIKSFSSPCANILLRNYTRVVNDQFLNEQYRRKKSSRVKATERKKMLQSQLVTPTPISTQSCTDELCLDETEFQDQDDVQVLSAYIEHLNRQDEIELDEIDFSGDEQSGSTPSKFLFS